MDIRNIEIAYAGTVAAEAIYAGSELIWSGGTTPTTTPPPAHDYSQDYLTFRATSGNTFIDITFPDNDNGESFVQSNSIVKFEASNDGGNNWMTLFDANNGDTAFDLSTYNSNKTLGSGDTMMFRGVATSYGNEDYSQAYMNITVNGAAVVEGNINSLIDYDDFTGFTNQINNCAFLEIFRGSTGLNSAENLILPYSSLTYFCYGYMFADCTSLTSAPELPATTLANQSYQGMFFNCSSLSAVTCLATDISADFCTSVWVYGVASSGTFTKNASMSSWTTGNNGIPTNWTVVDYN